MPPAGTVALSDFLNSASGSSSRKRSHAEITRSQSRSRSPEHIPSKRRRTSSTIAQVTAQPRSSRSSDVGLHHEPVFRFIGDGYDYRRPVMATQSRRTTATPIPNEVVDLTADDSDNVSTASEESEPSEISRPPSRRRARHARVQEWREMAQQQRQLEYAVQLHGQQRRRAQMEYQQYLDTGRVGSQAREHEQGIATPPQHQQPRAPPFDQTRHEEPIIVLSDEDDVEPELEEFEISSDIETTDSDSVASIASPEVQFLEERRIPQPPRPPAEIAADVVHMGPRPPVPGINLPDLLRRGTQIVFGNIQNTLRDYNEGFLDRLDGVPRRNQGNEGGPMNVTMDYNRTGFAMGGLDPFDRSSETPQVVQEPYKAPPAAKEGFTRTFAAEDVVLCPMCGDELAVGKSDAKQQVWVVRGCGHVYCGECAMNRSKSSKKGKGKEQERKLESVRSQPFAVCQVDDCNQKLAAKGAMFPVYL